MAIFSFDYVSEVYDCVLGCVTEETSGVQLGNSVTILDSLKVRLSFLVYRGQSLNLLLLFIFFCCFSLGISYVLASVTILGFGGVFVTVLAIGICS